ncbi:MAG: DUF1598 domain-containing protein [Pirellulales bacterium]|nr:DUF1598 domain-containing protein [Pirellulales bacterium]
MAFAPAPRARRKFWLAATSLAALLTGACFEASTLAQTTGVGFVTQPVGGVFVDANGVVGNAETDALGKLQQLRKSTLEQIPGDLNEPAELRKVSLRRLEAALAEHLKTGKPLPQEMQYLAGLQRIRYVFVYPEQQDIVLAGPAEGWRVEPHGAVVGATSGLPVMQLDDLVVALRSVNRQSPSAITCSIDPTADGMARLQTFVKGLREIGANPQVTMAALEEQLGPQQISVGGVPADSHFARVLVAADYRMKRLGMGFDPSPVPGMPSFLQMAKPGGNMMPRWWMAPNYEPMLRDADGLAWELRGASVKAMTEDAFFNEQGVRQTTGHASPVAQRWADTMTEKYDELALAEPIFAELRNVMDLAVVAALVAREDLTTKAGYSMPLLLDPSDLAAAKYPAPRQVDSVASFVKKGRNYVISVSGGVDINPWAITERSETNDSLDAVRTAQEAPAAANRWWWN